MPRTDEELEAAGKFLRESGEVFIKNHPDFNFEKRVAAAAEKYLEEGGSIARKAALMRVNYEIALSAIGLLLRKNLLVTADYEAAARGLFERSKGTMVGAEEAAKRRIALKDERDKIILEEIRAVFTRPEQANWTNEEIRDHLFRKQEYFDTEAPQLTEGSMLVRVKRAAAVVRKERE